MTNPHALLFTTQGDAEHRRILTRFWKPTAIPTPNREYVSPEQMAKRIAAHKRLMTGLARLKEQEAAA